VTATTAGSPPSKAEFVRQANAVCRETRAGLADEIADFERHRAPNGADAVHFVLLPTMEEEISGVEELDIPPSAERRVNWLLFRQKSTLDNLAIMSHVSVEAAKRRFAGPGRQLTAYGLSACAYPG
jgi:hypothetical protein